MQTTGGPGTPFPPEVLDKIMEDCRNFLTPLESFQISRSHPRFYAAATPSRLTVLPASRAAALSSAPLDPDSDKVREQRHVVPFHRLHLFHQRVRAFSTVMSRLPGAGGQLAYTFQGISRAEVCLPPSAAQRNMLADALRHLALRSLVVSVQEMDGLVLLSFIERLHLPQSRPTLVSVQLNIFLSRNNPASELNPMEEEDSEAEDYDEDSKDDTDDDEDEDEDFEPVGRLAFWTDPTWKACLAYLSWMKTFWLWTQKELRTRAEDLERVMPVKTRKVAIHCFRQHFGLGTVIEGFGAEVFERAVETGPEALPSPDMPRPPTWRQVSGPA